MMSLLYMQVEQDVAWSRDSVESCEQAVQFTHQTVLARKCAGSPQQTRSGSLERRHWVSRKFCVMQQNSRNYYCMLHEWLLL